MRRPVSLWDGICNSNVLHYFHLSFITELFILLVSMLQVFWYLQVYFQPRMGVTDSSFFSKHPLSNSFCSRTMFLTKARQNKRQNNKPTNQPWKPLPIYQLPVHKKQNWLTCECSCQPLCNREIISNPNFELQQTIIDLLCFFLSGTIVYTTYGWISYAQVD